MGLGLRLRTQELYFLPVCLKKCVGTHEKCVSAYERVCEILFLYVYGEGREQWVNIF